jgi:hypothetical protein
MIEDRSNRFNFEFLRPSKAQGMKGMMAKGPELRMEIAPSRSQQEKEASAIKIRVFRGKKNVFKDDILVSNSDIERLKKFIKENFAR